MAIAQSVFAWGGVSTEKGWRVREQGTVFGIRFVLFVATALGRRGAHAVLRLITVYYALIARTPRRAIAEYFRHLGETPTFSKIWSQFHVFAQVAVDRLFFLRGDFHHFVVERTGHEHLVDLVQRKRGALLLGAHLGSFEAMRSVARDFDVPLWIVVDYSHTKRINEVLARISGSKNVQLIELSENSIESVLQIKERIDQGDLVAILVDRPSREDHKNVAVDFLGGTAHLPMGPYVLANALSCPVMLVFGLYYSPNRYHLYCEPFSDCVCAPRRNRLESVTGYAQQYADRLAHFVRLAPDNWFNFFHFWDTPLPPSSSSEKSASR